MNVPGQSRAAAAVQDESGPAGPPAGVPDATGHFGPYGGRFAPEALIPALDGLAAAYREAQADPQFRAELDHLLRTYAGRPTPVTEVARFAAHAGGCRVLLKREDLAHTGSHKINNVLGQALLARRMGKRRVIAETGAGQHGVATATACALFGLECVVYMGEEDTRRQALNVVRMRMLGAEVVPVKIGSRTLKDAMNEAFRDWVATVEHTHYCIGSVGGPHPFPVMVRDFQRIIGVEARQQVLELTGRLPDAVVACVGGGSNAIGVFHAFIPDPSVRLIGCEAGGTGLATGRHAATLVGGSAGILHGMRTYLLQDADGQTLETHSISAGLDYPGVGPEHAWLRDTGRAAYRAVTDQQAMDAFGLLCRNEGIIPALESAHALAGALGVGRELGPDAMLLVNLSGRGDKDVDTAARWLHLDQPAASGGGAAGPAPDGAARTGPGAGAQP
jgi:tryptophan synthase beta chain